MAYLPISKSVPQYSTSSNELADGYYLKGYIAGTTTALSMATDEDAGTLIAKCKIGAKGYPLSDSGDESSIFIPYFNRDYKLVLYKNDADADADNTGAADWVVDNIKLGTTDTYSALYTVGASNSIVSQVANSSAAVGDIFESNYYDSNLTIGSGAKWKCVALGATPPDGASGINSDGYLYSAASSAAKFEIVGCKINLRQFGAVSGSDISAIFNKAIAALSASGGVIEGCAGDAYTATKFDADSAIKLDSVFDINLVGNGASITLAAAQNCHIIKVIGNSVDATAAGRIDIFGWVLDSNMANQTDNASNQDTIRLTNCNTVHVFDNEIRDTNSSGVVCDGTSDVHIYCNYIHDIGRNGVIIGCSALVNGYRNKVYNNRIIDTGLNALGNGVFATASSTSVSTTAYQYDFECYGNHVENAGDIGIESGIRCVNSQVHHNHVKASLNQGIIVRDNLRPVISYNTIEVDTVGAGTKTGITVDTQLGSGDGNEITTSKGIISGNIIVNVDLNGVELKDLSDWQVFGNSITGVDNTGSSGINIKSNNCLVFGNNIKTLLRGIRIAEENLASINNVDVFGNRIDDTVNGIYLENVALNDSRIHDNDITDVTTGFSQTGSTLDNVVQYGNRRRDSFANPAASMSTFINAIDGVQRDSPAAQFGATSIQAPAYNSVVRVIGVTTGEMAVFAVDAGGGAVTKLSGSTNIGVAADSTDYRVEISSGNLVFKRYSVSQTIASFIAEIS